MKHYSTRKRFGQNFLQDQIILTAIVDFIDPKPNQRFVEIGPGLGALTVHILPLVNQLDVIELDRDLIPRLIEHCHDSDQLIVHQADVLTYDFHHLGSRELPLRVFGNLPYNISTPLLFHLLDQIDVITDMHFMLQREVAERITAKVGSKAYGKLSVMIQYFCQVQHLLEVPPEAFFPVPKVYSGFIRLQPYKTPEVIAKNIHSLQQVVAQAFNQRRKKISNSLKMLVSAQQLADLGIDPQLRAEQLSVADFVNISNTLESN